MRINSDDRLSYIEMIVQGTSSEEDTRLSGRHDVYVSIEVARSGFCGHNENIGFAEDEIRRFTSDMKDLEDRRRGVAKLVSIGYPSEYTELIMEIYSTDQAGHFAIKLDLQKIQYSRSGMSPSKISVGFDLEPSDLPYLLTDFEALFSSQGTSAS